MLFTLFPMIATLVVHVHQHQPRPGEPLQFVGLENYQDLLDDQQAWDVLGVTLKFALLALPVAVILPFLVALMLHSRHLRGAGAFRVLFFLPYVVPFVAGVLIWGGDARARARAGSTAFLRAIGIAHPPAWLEDPAWIYPGLVIMGVWGIGAGMIVYLAGLKGIPTELYDAARIDGAGRLGEHSATSRSR